MNPELIALQWTPTPGGTSEILTPADPAGCGPESFTVEGGDITLCPGICDEVSQSEERTLTVLAGCGTDDGTGSDDECVPTSNVESICDDGIDNDCDGAIDRDEIECIQ